MGWKKVDLKNRNFKKCAVWTMLGKVGRMTDIGVWGWCLRVSLALTLGFLPRLSNSAFFLVFVACALKVSLTFGTRSHSGMKK